MIIHLSFTPMKKRFNKFLGTRAEACIIFIFAFVTSFNDKTVVKNGYNVGNKTSKSVI
jgi:hypothetical protein